jgi:hypothetical protein
MPRRTDWPQTASRKVTLTLTLTLNVRILTSSLSSFSDEEYSRFACGVACPALGSREHVTLILRDVCVGVNRWATH